MATVGVLVCVNVVVAVADGLAVKVAVAVAVGISVGSTVALGVRVGDGAMVEESTGVAVAPSVGGGGVALGVAVWRGGGKASSAVHPASQTASIAVPIFVTFPTFLPPW